MKRMEQMQMSTNAFGLPRVLLVAIWSMMLVGLVGCDPSSEGANGDGEEILQQPKEEIRVVTLAPALTQMLIDLGLEETIVGVSENDAIASPDVPVCGTFTQPNAEKLIELKPTYVLMMVGKDGVPEDLEQLGAANDFYVVSYPYPTSVNDVENIVFDIGAAAGQPTANAVPSLGSVFGMARQAARLRLEMATRLAGIQSIITESGAKRPRVLMVINTKPIMASGEGTVLNELLYFAGGVNAAESDNKTEDSSTTAPVYTKEGLAELRPEVILFLEPGGSEIEHSGDVRLLEFKDLEEVPAIENKRTYVIDLPQIAAAMAKVIHPNLAPQIDKFMATEMELKTIEDRRLDDAREDVERMRDEAGSGDETDKGDEATGDPLESGDATADDEAATPDADADPDPDAPTDGGQ